MNSIYKWKIKDTIIVDILYAIPLIGIIVLFIIDSSFFFLFLFLFLYVIMNILIAFICHECPHRGHFCPGVSQLLFGPLLSKFILRGKKITNKMLKMILIIYGIIGLGNFILAFFILFIIYWNKEVWIVFSLVISFTLYSIVAWPIFCPKCSFNKKCPVRNLKSLIQN